MRPTRSLECPAAFSCALHLSIALLVSSIKLSFGLQQNSLTLTTLAPFFFFFSLFPLSFTFFLSLCVPAPQEEKEKTKQKKNLDTIARYQYSSAPATSRFYLAITIRTTHRVEKKNNACMLLETIPLLLVAPFRVSSLSIFHQISLFFQ